MAVMTPTRQGALTTLARAKEELELEDERSDALLQRLINSASQMIEAYCRRVFSRWSGVEHVRGYGTDKLILSRTPLVEVTEIRVGMPPDPKDVIPSGEYTISDHEAGFVMHRSGRWRWSGANGQWLEPYRIPGTERPIFAVEYTGGYVTPKQAEDDPELRRDLPYDLEDACIMLVATRYGGRGERRDIQSESVMSASFTYRRGAMPQEVTDLLAPYRRVV